MNINSWKYKIWTILFLVIVVCVSTAMLDVVYVRTEPTVQKNERIKLEQNILDVFEIPYRQSNIEEIFKDNIIVDNKDGMEIYRSEKGIAFEVTGSGFWDMISILVALEYDMETIKGLKILKHAETPGLGARITEKWFIEQFKGKKIIPELKIVPHKVTDIDATTSATKTRPENEVDAITGATETSKALERIINNGVNSFYQKMSLKK
jgi:Na+-transporting NADH:ubiquinone oxidoreductase subunit C